MNIKNTIFFNGRDCSVMIYGILWTNISILDRCFYHVYSVTSHNNPGVYMIASCGLIHLLFFQHTSSTEVISFHSAISKFKKKKWFVNNQINYLFVPAAPCSYSSPVSAAPAVPLVIPLLLAFSLASSGFDDPVSPIF